tara:strand:- start:1545 stop:2120 length:576 start_codon:yes stop_codon:yes gene_type:complete
MDKSKAIIFVGLIVLAAALCYAIKMRTSVPVVDSFVSSCGTSCTASKPVVSGVAPVPSCVEKLSGGAPKPSGAFNSGPKPLVDGSENALGAAVPASSGPKGTLAPADLLPSSEVTKWSHANPVGKGALEDQNFLHAGFHVGINTVGQSLRNANMQLRSEPPNPLKKVGPWMQSTIEPDLNRRPLEIAGESS